ncbi:MAG: DUF1232 domain-containing protein [Anaerolineae bacterium]|jgi:uncharacterized membrane protein YkvA (DUF1232 family)
MGTFSPSSELQKTAGFLAGLIKQARLAWRLLNDSRVPAWIKLIPVAGLVYFLSPVDLIPDLMLPGLGEVDDVILILLALRALVDLSPPGVVREHLDELLGKRKKTRTGPNSSSEPYIDVPYRILDPEDEQ